MEYTEKKCIDTNIAEELLKKLDEQKKKDIECDFYLKCDNGRQSVHRCLIRAISPTIDRLFSQNLDSDSVNSFDLGAISAQTLDTFVKYIYETELILDQTNALELLQIGKTLHIKFVRDACLDFLTKQLSESNCITLLLHASVQQQISLADACVHFIAKHFESLCDSKEFLDIPFAELLYILMDDDLSIACEFKAFDTIRRWINSRFEERQCHATKLCNYIRFQLIEMHKLLEILQCTEDKIFHEHVKKALCDLGDTLKEVGLKKWHRKTSFEQSFDKLIDSSNFMVNPIHVETVVENEESLPCFRKNELPTLIILGGRLHEKKFSNQITVFEVNKLMDMSDFQTRKSLIGSITEDPSESGFSPTFPHLRQINVFNFNTLPKLRRGFGAAYLSRQIYLIGGRPLSSMSTVDIYDITRSEWTLGSPLQTARAWHSVVEADGILFAIGGSDKNGLPLQSAEFLDSRVGTWQRMPNMQEARFGHTVCTQYDEIIAVGGANNYSIEIYDRVAGSWRIMDELSVVREGCNAVAHDGLLHVFGGANEFGCLDTMEVHQLDQNAWAPGIPMIMECAFAATVKWDHHALVLGGRNNKEPSGLIQVYNLVEQTWAILPQRLLEPVSSCCAVICDDDSIITGTC